jgi:hypothetical protein
MLLTKGVSNSDRAKDVKPRKRREYIAVSLLAI